MSEAATRAYRELNVSRETFERLDALVALLLKWNDSINLIGRNTESDVWSRHILDSAQLLPLCPTGATRWLDLGSGGGLPALVVAIMAPETRPDLRLIMIESDQRKAAFLRAALRQLGLSAEIRAERIEDSPSCNADIISARALGPLTTLLAFAERHGHDRTICLFQKGRTVQTEIDAARKEWTFDLRHVQSTTDPEGAILIVEDIARA